MFSYHLSKCYIFLVVWEMLLYWKLFKSIENLSIEVKIIFTSVIARGNAYGEIHAIFMKWGKLFQLYRFLDKL